jgi:hypothetical protein
VAERPGELDGVLRPISDGVVGATVSFNTLTDASLAALPAESEWLALNVMLESERVVRFTVVVQFGVLPVEQTGCEAGAMELLPSVTLTVTVLPFSLQVPETA